MSTYFNYHWQFKRDIIQSLRYMLEHQIATDVRFIIGDKKITVEAHKFMLICRSSVFYAMFEGPLAETGDIYIPDLDAHTFKSILKYMYTDTVSIKGENVLRLLYASTKYWLHDLTQRCFQFLEKNITPDTVCAILEAAHTFENTKLRLACLDYICKNAAEAFKSESFSTLCSHCLEEITKSELLIEEEEEIYTAVMKWAESQCKRRNIAAADQNIREVLGDIIYSVRFPLMSFDFFVDEVSNRSLLSPSEKTELFKFHFNPKDYESNMFKCSLRPTNYVKVFRSTKLPIRQWSHVTGRADALAFEISATTWLYGVIVFGACCGHGKHQIHIEILDQYNKEVCVLQTVLCSTPSEITHDIFLPKPVKVPSSTRYTIVVTMEGPDTFKVTAPMETLYFDDRYLSFYDSKWSANGTTVKNGQIPGLILHSRSKHSLQWHF